MADLGGSRAPDITYVGRVARRAMRDGARGRVEAVFERSFYVVLDHQWICMGPHTLGQGPLNALWSPADAVALPALGARVSLIGETLNIDGRAFAHGRPRPEPMPFFPRPWTAGTLARGLQAFDEVTPGLAPEDGLCALICGHLPLPRYAAAAAAPVAHLGELVRRRARDRVTPRPDAALLAPLLGLGPGLTPSGDDLLGGALATLAAIGFADLRNAIWAAIGPDARSRTNDIAFAHLSAAAEGECAPALTDAIDALLSGRAQDLPSALEGLAAVGHTSGWDALAGGVIVLRGLQAELG
jgi:hypothetical protein